PRSHGACDVDGAHVPSLFRQLVHDIGRPRLPVPPNGLADPRLRSAARCTLPSDLGPTVLDAEMAPVPSSLPDRHGTMPPTGTSRQAVDASEPWSSGGNPTERSTHMVDLAYVIAGSEATGGAGLQADLKTFQ